jgi:hypothetical protein
MLEYWNDGIVGDLVMNNVKERKWDSALLALLAEFLLTENLNK